MSKSKSSGSSVKAAKKFINNFRSNYKKIFVDKALSKNMDKNEKKLAMWEAYNLASPKSAGEDRLNAATFAQVWADIFIRLTEGNWRLRGTAARTEVDFKGYRITPNDFKKFTRQVALVFKSELPKFITWSKKKSAPGSRSSVLAPAILRDEAINFFDVNLPKEHRKAFASMLEKGIAPRVAIILLMFALFRITDAGENPVSDRPVSIQTRKKSGSKKSGESFSTNFKDLTHPMFDPIRNLINAIPAEKLPNKKVMEASSQVAVLISAMTISKESADAAGDTDDLNFLTAISDKIRAETAAETIERTKDVDIKTLQDALASAYRLKDYSLGLEAQALPVNNKLVATARRSGRKSGRK